MNLCILIGEVTDICQKLNKIAKHCKLTKEFPFWKNMLNLRSLAALLR